MDWFSNNMPNCSADPVLINAATAAAARRRDEANKKCIAPARAQSRLYSMPPHVFCCSHNLENLTPMETTLKLSKNANYFHLSQHAQHIPYQNK